jgi:hypothetical protein
MPTVPKSIVPTAPACEAAEDELDATDVERTMVAEVMLELGPELELELELELVAVAVGLEAAVVTAMLDPVGLLSQTTDVG